MPSKVTSTRGKLTFIAPRRPACFGRRRRNYMVRTASHRAVRVGVPMSVPEHCAMCGMSSSTSVLAEAHWYPFWKREDGACPACVQQNLLRTLLAKGDAALHESIQTVWPLDEGFWQTTPTSLPAGQHSYKFLIDGQRRLDDPGNPRKMRMAGAASTARYRSERIVRC